MAWAAFKFIVWFCKWRNKRNLDLAVRYHNRAQHWFRVLARIGEMIAKAENERH
jgi:hypothetical protein